MSSPDFSSSPRRMARAGCSAPSAHQLWRAIVFVLVVLCNARVIGAQAQATTGIIRGVVRDSAFTRIVDASVTARNVATNFTRTAATNREGAYALPLLPLGTYEVTARAIGYAPVRRAGIPVRLGATADLTFVLVRQAISLAAVQVTGAREAIDKTQSAAATELDARVVAGLPNNGRNYLGLVLLTPNTAIVQGPDGDELSIAGQRGIHNNISIDGADFNNPFFGEQRGGQRAAFTFNLDAVQDMVVIASGANAEFGRSGGGFVNVVTKSGTNTTSGTVHLYGKADALASSYPRGGGNPDFAQQQFGFTLGGPIVRDRAFYFIAYDQQLFNQTKQDSVSRIDSRLRQFMDTAYGRVLANDYGPIRRTNDANALLVKLDAPLGTRHNASLKYNFTNSKQENGTFDVDTWARSANAVEKDYSHALNGSLASTFRADMTNEFRFQIAREYRPRPYDGPINPRTNRPFPDTGMDFVNGYRFGMPFFIPIQAHDDRIQVLDNVSLSRGSHLFKFGGEWNRTSELQTFVGFGNGRMIFGSVDGFLNYNRLGNTYVECSNGTSNVSGTCPAGSTITGPVLLYLQQAGIGGRSVEEAGTQSIPQHELALFAQDSWKPTSRLTVNYGLRWEAQIEPDVITPPDQVFYAPFIGQTRKGQLFPSDGRIPSDWKMFQPRVGFVWDVDGDNRSVVRASTGIFYARVPGLVLAGTRNTNGSIGQTLFRNSAASPFLGPPPRYGELLPTPAGGPFQPSVTVFDRDFRNPRTVSATIGYERALVGTHTGEISYTAAATDFLTRFIDRNDPVFGSPWASNLSAAQPANGLGTLTTVESSAKSRYQGVTVALRQIVDPRYQYEVNYTLSYDRSDDDNERDPFSFRYARADQLGPEYGFSDRDQRHRFSAWALTQLPWHLGLNNKISAQSAQPRSAKCGANNQATETTAATGSERICPNGTILQRNTLRKDNAFFSWDVRLSRLFETGRGRVEAIAEVFNVTNSDNFKDPASGGLLFNFDGTVRSGLGDPRQAQLGLRYLF